jgi:broad-specificity NMP kinase
MRQELQHKKFILLYGYNGTGKTRLSGAFKDLGKQVNDEGETTQRDTLYFNAYAEDLFSWNNDLEKDRKKCFAIGAQSKDSPPISGSAFAPCDSPQAAS